ncbi:hypothetical protein PP408_25535 [Mycobacteroides abscessus]|uniref:hypothetical protein n=1 Tax=Mycobacteroides abscessus TaxID=36809 RepID=UPI000927D6BA|nr:hypothetical protein [Mycobacteroides abscessus]MDM1973659.1 hypothetical protein [Mycobacteroides abscessus]SIL01811.1 Uncharacterised protein [Mycobacteroides abscessus subsp. abscessus]SKT09518.1 Uncharacterised protein [Mycobacteroides abscessus subsp. abscessus]
MTSSNRRRFARPFALALIAAGATVVVAPPAAATPNAGDTVNFSSACGDQYPAADGFSIGQAYLVSPQDAYSWRCKQVAASGGVIADLPVNPNLFCAPLIAKPSPDGSEHWICSA